MQSSLYKVTVVQSGWVYSDSTTTSYSQYSNEFIYQAPSTTQKSSSGIGKVSFLSLMTLFLALSATAVAEFIAPENVNRTLFLIANYTGNDPKECGVVHEFSAPTYFNDGEIEMLVFKTDDDALSYAESLYLNTSITIDLPLFVQDTNTLITDLNITELPITKRWSCSSAPLGSTFTQKQNAQYGVWWGEWVAASECFWTGLGNGGSKTHELQSCRSWSVNAGFSLELVKGLGFLISSEITNQDCQTDLWTCEPGTWNLQFWKQQQYLWADQQQQTCIRRYYGKDGCKCGPWGPYIHGDVPTKVISYGCSTDGDTKCDNYRG